LVRDVDNAFDRRWVEEEVDPAGDFGLDRDGRLVEAVGLVDVGLDYLVAQEG
jgi:hypothetical protein